MRSAKPAADRFTGTTRTIQLSAAESLAYPDVATRQIAEDAHLVDVRDGWVEVDIDAHWRVALRLSQDEDGEPVFGELRLFPRERNRPRDNFAGRWSAEVRGYRAKAPRNGVTARLLRKMPLGERGRFLAKIISSDERELSRELSVGGHVPPWLEEHTVDGWLARTPRRGPRGEKRAAPDSPTRIGRGRPPVPDLELARLAQAYVKRFGVGKSRQATRDAADDLDLDYSVALNRVLLARRRGFLVRTGNRQGVAGGVLSAKARAVLETAAGR